MRNLKELQQKYVEFELGCFDRLYLNLYCPILCSLGGLAVVIRRVLDWAAPVPAAFRPYRDEFVEMVEVFAEERGLEIHRFDNREQNSKEEIARKHLARWEGEGSDVFFIAKAQEKVKVPQGSWRPSKAGGGRKWFELRWGYVLVNQYYFYFWDDDWGMGFIKFSSYAPFSGRFYINAHEYVKRQLEKQDINFTPLDNGIGKCEDPGQAQRIARSISAAKLRALVKYWMDLVPNPLKTLPARTGGLDLKYQISVLQAEIALTQLWKKARHGLEFFEQAIRENIDLGRPENVGVIFDKRIKRITKQKRFMTRVFTSGVIPVFSIFYKSNKLKQYYKEAKALRNELTVNNPRDFGIGKLLNTENLNAMYEVGMQTINRLLRTEVLSHDPAVSLERIEQIESPAEVGGRRVSPLPRSNTRVRALLNALIGCHLICGGFRNRELRARVAHLLGKDPDEITSGQMTYDLRRLRGHGLIEKRAGTHRYELSAEGLHLALFISRVERRVYREGMAEVFDASHTGGLQMALQRFDRETEALMKRHLVLES